MDRIVRVVLRGEVGDFVGKMRASSSAVKSTVGSMTEANKEAGRFREGLTSMGSAATKAGLVAAGGLALITKAAMDWESSWAGVLKTVEGTPAQLSSIESGLRSMAKTIPTSAGELASIAEAAGALGVETSSILKFTRVAADLGETTNLSSEAAATGLSQFMNILQTAPGDIDRLGSTLVALGNNGASTEAQILDMSQQIAGAGAIIGASEPDILALSNALASVGIDAEAGGSAVSKVLIDMSTAVSTNSDELRSFASVSGKTTQQFAKDFKDKPVQAFDAFTKGLGEINKQGGDVFTILSDLGQSDVRVTRALLGMANSGDLLSDSLEMGSEAWAQNTALAKEAETRYGTTAAQVQIAWNEIKDAAIDAGASLLPVARSIAGAVGSVANAFGGLPSPVQSGLTAVGGIAAIALLVVGATAKMVTSLAASKLAMEQLGLSAGKTGKALMILARAGGGLAAFWAGAALGDKIGERGSKAIGEMAKGLEKLGKSGKATGDLKDLFGEDLSGNAVRFGKDLGSIGEALKSLDGYADDSSITEALKFFGSAGQSAGITAQAEAIGDMDKAFAELARNKPDAAIAAFEKLRDRAVDTGASVEDVSRAFPQMTELLRGASESLGGTSDASEILEGSLTQLAPAAAASAESIKAAQDALDAARESATATSLSFFNFARDAKQSFGDYLNELEKSAKAYRDFTKNALLASENGLDGGLIDQLKQQGPEGARALSDFANASEKEIARANRAFRDTSGLSELEAELSLLPDDVITEFKAAGAPRAIETAAEVADQYNMSPALVETILKAKNYAKKDIDAVLKQLAILDATTATPTVDLKTGGAIGTLSGIAVGLANLRDKTVTVTTRNQTENANGGVWEYYAKGGLREQHVAQIAPAGAMRVWAEPETGGEAYIPLATSKRARSKTIAEQTVGLMGGSVSWFANGGVDGVSKLDILDQQRTVRDIERSLRERETVGKGKSKRRRNVLRGLDRQIARLELAEARAELSDLRKGGATRREAAEARVEARQKRIDDAMGERDSVASSLSGGFGIGQFTGKNEYGVYGNLSGSSIAAGAKAYAAKLKSFASKIEKARKLGIPVRMLQEVSALGADEGTQALDALLSSSSGDIATLKTAYRDIDTYAKGAGEVIAKALDLQAQGKDSAEGWAKGFVEGLNGRADLMKKAKDNATNGKRTAVPSSSGSQGPYRGPGVVGTPLYGTPLFSTTSTAAAQTTVVTPIDYDQLASAIARNPAQVVVGNRAASQIVQVGTQTQGKQA